MLNLWDDFTNYVGAIGSTAGSLYGLFTNQTPPADTSVILLDGKLLPGIVQSEEIIKELRVESIPIEDLSGSVKLVHGHNDAVLRYAVTLTADDIDDGLAGDIGSLLSGDLAEAIDGFFGGDTAAPLTAVQKLASMTLFFQQYTADGNIKVWEISQELATAAGISRVLFGSLQIGRSSNSDKIDLSLDFLEYQPATVLFETGAAVPPPPPDTPDPDTIDPFDEV